MGLGACCCNLVRTGCLHALDPLRRRRHLRRVSGGGQDLGHQRVRIERDGRHKLLQLRCAKRLHLGIALLAVSLLMLVVHLLRIPLILLGILRELLRVTLLRVRLAILRAVGLLPVLLLLGVRLLPVWLLGVALVVLGLAIIRQRIHLGNAVVVRGPGRLRRSCAKRQERNRHCQAQVQESSTVHRRHP